MSSPITVYDKNEYSFILMKNRYEPLAEIPVGYVESIRFTMGKFINEPAQVNITIPSILERNGQKVEQPLFNMVKPKMQIHMNINGKDYMLDIWDVQENENKNYTTKSITAYERHKRWEDLDCTLNIGNIVTRQLYCPSYEEVELSEGMLNIFTEQCLGWSIDEDNVTQMARQEYIMCSTTNTLYFDSVDLVVEDVIFNQDISNAFDKNGVVRDCIDIGDKPINLTLNMFNEVYDLDTNPYITSNLAFKIDSIPYPIKNITAKVVSTNKNFYGIEITLTHTEGHKDKDGNFVPYTTVHEFAYINCKGLQLKAEINVVYEYGDLAQQWVTKYRTFENGGAKWNTMMDNIAQSFDCVFIVDSYNQKIEAYHSTEFFGDDKDTGITLLYDNAINEITRTRGLDDLVTRMWVESSNTTIASVNVLGTDYIECYDYFINEGIMSDELVDALKTYDLLLEEKQVEFNDCILTKHEADQTVSLIKSQITSLEGQISGAKALLTAYVKQASEDGTPQQESMWADDQAKQQAIVDDLENQLKVAQTNLTIAETEAERLQGIIIQIGIDIKKENAVYNGQNIFTADMLLELSDYLIEKSIEDDTHLTAYSLYSYAQDQVIKYQKPIIDFTINTSMEFLKRAGLQVTDVMFLGAKVAIEDKAQALDSENDLVSVYSFTLDPNTDEISNFKFVNNAEAPDSALKSISRTAQVTKATKSLTDFYKATWVDMKNKALDIDEILTQGLDLSAQKVRSRTEENIIDITEAGIFCIDTKNNNEQLAIMNDLITMTTDNWRTSRVAISPEGVMADTIIGRLLMGNELYISNENSSFYIGDDEDDDVGYGLRVSNKYGQTRMFMGLEEQEPRFLVGGKDGYYLEWLDDKLVVNASSIKIGSSKVATQNDVQGAIDGVLAGLEIDNKNIMLYVDDTAHALRSEINVAVGQVEALVSDTAKDLESKINITANGITSTVKKGSIISSINQTAETIKIKASKIDLTGAVTVSNDNRYIKLDTGNYSVYEDKIRKAYFGFGKVEIVDGVYTDYYVPRISMGGDGINKMTNEYFTVITYKGNKENPQKMDYSYVDIAYHSRQYDRGDGEGDWSNVKLYANGDMRVSPIRKLEITSNFKNGAYPPNNNGHEYLVAEFRTDNHTWYNGNLSVGAVVNRSNGNGLILIDQHDSLNRQAGVRVQCNNNGEKSFRPLTDGDCYNGTTNYRWKKVFAVNSTVSTSDERHKVIFGAMNNFDCYEMIKNIPLYNYYMLGENKNNLTEKEIKEKMIDENKQMGLMAQDLLGYGCGEYILDYENDIYGINEGQLVRATIGALQEEIHLRDKQIEELKNDVEELKRLIGGE